jgi:hypothetical protein
MVEVNYWKLKNPDLFISKIVKERVELILNQFEKVIAKYCKGSYQDLYAKDDRPLFYKSDQRIDFMMNLYQEIIRHYASKLAELNSEVDRRRT